MIVLVMILILAGSAAGTIILWLQDAPWWQIALGYVAGGWAGLLAGLPVAMVAGRRWRTRPPACGSSRRQAETVRLRHAIIKRAEKGR